SPFSYTQTNPNGKQNSSTPTHRHSHLFYLHIFPFPPPPFRTSQPQFCFPSATKSLNFPADSLASVSMEVRFHRHAFVSSSSSSPSFSRNTIQAKAFAKRVVQFGYLMHCSRARRRSLKRLAFLGNGSYSSCYQLVGSRKQNFDFYRRRRLGCLLPCGSADDSVTVNGSPTPSTSGDVEEIRMKLNQSLQGEDQGDTLVQSLHDAARVFELAIKERGLVSKFSWFSTAWLGGDGNAWLKTLSYQASVYSLLQAACEISSRRSGGDKDVNIFVQRSLLRVSASLESLIREKLSAKQLEPSEWFWAEQIPLVVTSFVNYFDGAPRFTVATAVSGRGMYLGSDGGTDTSILLLALTCIAAITKLGPAKISCPQLFPVDITGKMMDMLVDLIPIRQAYRAIKDIGLRREFLVHFGPRAAACRVQDDLGAEEVAFWVNLVQKQLQRAIDREKIWSRLTTSESIEVLDKDLAVIGFFIALGRSTQSFLSANGFDVVNEPIDGFLRYLISGSVLYYPQLSSISSYQLYVEVVCEELDWLQFYPGHTNTLKQSYGHGKQENPPNAEAIPQVLDVCSHWMQSFIKYSKWVENPSNVKAARFLSKGHKKLMECVDELGISRNVVENDSNFFIERAGSSTYLPTKQEKDSFEKALEGVEEALIRLENLLQEFQVSSSSRGKEQLKAACSDLEKIRKLKKEAEFLEVSFRVKAESLDQGDEDNNPQSSGREQQQYLEGSIEPSDRELQGLRSFIDFPTKKPDSELSSLGVAKSESIKIQRFELIRNELVELEKRVKRSTDQYENEEDVESTGDRTSVSVFFPAKKKEDIIASSVEKLKETSMDVLQGTQLLAIDVGAAMGLLRRSLIGDELTEKEKRALQRTVTDVASVVPIGVLMLLPVTAVGHAAILAAIQRYAPGMVSDSRHCTPSYSSFLYTMTKSPMFKFSGRYLRHTDQRGSIS
ncbi:unnamed protein product, partial [Linum tenue]